MNDFKKVISNTLKIVQEANNDKRSSGLTEIEDSICLFSNLMLQTACELTESIIDIREGGSRSGVNWIQSCLCTRYLFELCANHAILKNGEENEIMLRWEKYLYLRKLQIFGDYTYGICVDLLPEKTIKRLEKNNAETYLGRNHGDELTKENLKESVKLENEHFHFEDPWEMSMYDKLQFIEASNPKVFLSRWSMYSQISHASSFSIWPMWVDPVPHFDAIQCISLIFNHEFKYHNIVFDKNRFMDQIYKGIKEN